MADALTATPTKAGRRSMLWPTLFALPTLALLVGLGVWQLERLSWKEGILAQIESRMHAAAQPAPTPPQWPGLNPDNYEYRHVSAQGRFENDRETYIFRAGGSLHGRPIEPGYHVLTPLLLADGHRILINRGFVPQDRKDPATRQAGHVDGEQTVTGLMRSPEDRNPFTPADDPAHRTWYTRDAAAVARALDLKGVAPFVIDADDAPVPGGLPQGGSTEISVPNNHLSYAVTWFGLALTLVGVFGVFGWRRVRGR